MRQLIFMLIVLLSPLKMMAQWGFDVVSVEAYINDHNVAVKQEIDKNRPPCEEQNWQDGSKIANEIHSAISCNLVECRCHKKHTFLQQELRLGNIVRNHMGITHKGSCNRSNKICGFLNF